MHKVIFLVLLLIVQVTFAEGQLWLSPVNTGDCVAARIRAQKTRFVVELDKKYCARNLPDKAKERTCLENTRAETEFSFFTDRCSDREYFIGINGEEVLLRKISKDRGEEDYFIGTFAGNGVRVLIRRLRPVRKASRAARLRNSAGPRNSLEKVLVTVRKGKRQITTEGNLMIEWMDE